MMHLFAHAFFKAGLFLGAGAVIHSLHQLQQQTDHHFDVQDIRNLGGLRKHLPVTCLTFVLCSASLSGLPMFSGFLSKDAILTAVWLWKGSAFSWKWIVTAIAFSIPFLTVIYTLRMVWFTFFGINRTQEIVGKPITISEIPAVMRLPLILLSLGSLWLMISFNPFSHAGWLYDILQRGEETNLLSITVFSTLWVLAALIFAYLYFKNKIFGMQKGIFTASLLRSFYLDSLYRKIVIAPIHRTSMFTQMIDLKWIDGFIHAGVYVQVTFAHVVGWIDKFVIDGAVNGIARLAGAIGSLTKSFQGGRIQLYIFWSVLGIIIFLISILI